MQLTDFDSFTQITILLFASVLGMVFGSFFNMLIYRLPREKDIVFQPSHCPKCGHALSVLDLIPLFSWLLQLGKCRYCKVKIPVRYFIVECIMFVLVPVLFWQFGLTLVLLKYFLFFSSMVILFFADLETQIIPDFISLPLIVIGLVLAFFNQQFLDCLYGFLIGGLTIFAIGFFGKLLYKRDVMGGGDVKLLAGIGAFWGVKLTIVSLYLSFILGGLGGGLLLLLKLKKREDVMPFGPAIILGTTIAILWGAQIVDWYLTVSFISG